MTRFSKPFRLLPPKLCRKNGGELEQIKFHFRHSSIQTTERYLGSEQEIEIAVNDTWDFRLVSDALIKIAVELIGQEG
jgi:hypothetical protein